MRKDKGTAKFLKTTVLGGLVVLLPLALFYLVVSFLFYSVSGIVKPLLGLSDAYEAFKFPVLVDLFAFLFLLVLCFLIGLLVSTPFGQRWINRVERNILFKLPYYGTLREAVHQLLGNSNMNLFKVVLVDLYSNDTLTTGFITDESDGEYVTVFIPTGPNPTNGFIYHVKLHQIRHVDVKTEEAMRSIIGVGTGSAKLLNKCFGYERYDNAKAEESFDAGQSQQTGTYEGSINN